MKQLLKRTVLRLTRLLGYRQSEDRIVQQSGEFWHDTDAAQFRAYSHWKGENGIADSTFLELGRQHLNLFDRFRAAVQLDGPLGRMVEWGCGGGSNAIHFAPRVREFVGVDVSQATLDECQRTLREAGIEHFTPVLIDVATPESALQSIREPCDLFLCTYVMELVPTPEYGLLVVDIALKLLRPGGVAIIQIKYSTTDTTTQPRRWGYKLNAANMTTYPIDRFWELARSVGFEPIAITLQPRQDLIGDERYAYFVLRRP